MQKLLFPQLLHSTGISERSIIKLTKSSGASSLHAVLHSKKVPLDHVGLTLVERQWLEVPLDEQVGGDWRLICNKLFPKVTIGLILADIM